VSARQSTGFDAADVVSGKKKAAGTIYIHAG
jgi:hypothetical protein